MNPEFNGMKMNRVSICSRLPLQAVLGPLRRETGDADGSAGACGQSELMLEE